MLFLCLSILCSVLVSVWLKLARRFGLDVPQMVAWNYLAAGALVALVLHPSLAPLRQPDAPRVAVLALAVLLPAIFLALGTSVRHAGIVRSDVAQRLSLLAAFVWFGQVPTSRMLAGLALGLLALVAMVWRSHATSDAGTPGWLWPLVVFAGFGAIDILLKQVAAAGIPIAASLQAMFALALPVALGFALLARQRSGARFTARSLAGGLLLGLLNFGNILFYLRAHVALPNDPALVFATMNLGVVALGTLVGVLGFGERLSRINAVGLALAGAAIALLARS
ncbi:EamA/RhaT family transporter [Dyella sp.]|jgi:drug/metabolite transporter (DMT)-like permease|uniref:EamA/RhaT family transporter n=1 Tax=Dyella sp. TaxID=1869338 RepID=UPI002D77CDC0|nr:EamA/RhaT family transporter [Dyella sp.]HET6433889.1 EamA/RhaT family transporter [Dyella sp.]